MNSDKPEILIVEDEPAIVQLVEYALHAAGWSTRVAGDVSSAWECLRERIPQMVLLDWMLPDESGLRLLARIRAEPRLAALPVIMLTAKSMEEDKIEGLDRGADDYITKPFSPRELVSRMRALLRRRLPEHGEALLRNGPVVLDPNTRSVSVNGRPVEIGLSEYRLLKYLLAHPKRVHTRAQLLDRVWGDHVEIEERTVDVHVLRLRKALGDAESLVKTVRGVGYTLSNPQDGDL
ncbi:response regulator [Lacisediminimonas sp.]|uniref:response regulator n=1 Tax=Lacisediminimonas sp. TaxID=3060582 RepID=UPI002717FEF0|nr:response regulator [Lacisediminimonas sp.]MDO8299136.1 response regulator [Lacisediminimonas sp.]